MSEAPTKHCDTCTCYHNDDANKKRKIQSENEGAKSADEEDDVCCICMERRANTLVLPCMHVVVCDVCSRGLKNTPDRAKCVRCRGIIEQVLADETVIDIVDEQEEYDE